MPYLTPASIRRFVFSPTREPAPYEHVCPCQSDQQWPSGLPAAEHLPTSGERVRIGEGRIPRALRGWRDLVLREASGSTAHRPRLALFCGEPVFEPDAELFHAPHAFNPAASSGLSNPASNASYANLRTAAKRWFIVDGPRSGSASQRFV
jgi:hypothetical protein